MRPLLLPLILASVAPLRGFAADPPTADVAPGIAATERLAAAPHRFLYREHHDGRVVATIEARITNSAGALATAHLELRISAVAPEIEPPAGWQHLMGSNRTTALDLDRLKTGGNLAFGVARTDGGWDVDSATYLRTSGWMPLDERREEGDGTISVAVPSRRSYLTELTAISGPLRAGERDVAVLVVGSARLIVRYRLELGADRIVAIRDPRRPIPPAEPTP